MYEHNTVRFAVGEIPATYTGGIPSDVLDLHGLHTRFRTTYFNGFGRPESEVFFAASASGNFSTFSGARIRERTLEFDIDILDDVVVGMDLLQEYLPFGEERRFYVVDRGGKSVYIDGIVQELPCDYDAAKGHEITVVVKCPFPWFRSVERHEEQIGTTPRLLQTRGDIDAGIEVFLSGTVSELTVQTEKESFILSGTHRFSDAFPAMCSVEGNHVGYNADGTPLWANVRAGSEWVQIKARKGSEIRMNADGTVRWHDFYSGVVV